ncbi:spore protease YyaC [Paenibacillus larvae]|uniref:spore protease YyaC n=1 Tax=Paenibacillus larvae TaxID=1464 RepID=UPI0028BE20B4|nr:spore protease YyaC [Paenibacillus larvae]
MQAEHPVSSKEYWKKVKGEELASHLSEIVPSFGDNPPVFVCIGTDRSTGDALGPLVGTYLEEHGYPFVIGTLAYPCDASNIHHRLNEVPYPSKVIAIDACLGRTASVGLYQVSNQPLLPGKSLGKDLPCVGDFTIAAIVNSEGPRQYAVCKQLLCTKLCLWLKKLRLRFCNLFLFHPWRNLEYS